MNDRLQSSVRPVVNESGIEIKPVYTPRDVAESGGDGFIGKDTVAGGYGSRLRPFSRVTRVISRVRREFHDVPSVQLAYLAALAAEHGHEVRYTERALDDGHDADFAVVLSSLVDHRRETAFADRLRALGVPVGFVGRLDSQVRHRHAREERALMSRTVTC